MFEFLNPMFLFFAAGAALVPILIHLLRRNKAVQVDFSAMRFLMASTKPIVRWLRLKQILLLLMRIAAVALLALAFARPFLPTRQGLALWENKEREIGIVIDVSASLAAADHIEQARAHLADLLSHVGEGTLISAGLAGNAATVLAEREPFSIALKKRLLEAVKPTSRTGNLREALQNVDDMLRGAPTSQRELYVISDFQRSNWPDGSNLTLASNPKITLLSTAENGWNNAAIIEAKLPTKTGDPWLCSVRNYSPAKIREAEIKFRIGGKVIARQRVKFDGSATQVARFENIAVPVGAPNGAFELVAANDGFAADDQYYFVLEQNARTRILAVNGESAPGSGDELFFAKRAYTIKGSPYQLVISNSSEIDLLDLRAFDAVLLANVKGLNHKTQENLYSFVQHGAGLFFATGDRIEPALFNRFFAALSPVTLLSPGMKKIDRSSGKILLATAGEHPLLQIFGEAGRNNLSSARFYQYWQTEAKASAKVLARFDDGAAAIIESSVGRGKVILLTFPLDAEWSDLPIKPIYLPLLYAISDYLRPQQEAGSKYSVGQPILLGDRFTAATPVTVTTPTGGKKALAANALIFANTDMPGLYTFSQSGFSRQYAVNLDRIEGDPERTLPAAFLATLEAPQEKTSIDRSDRPVPTVAGIETEARQKLWRLLLFAVIVLLAGETLLANRTPR